uniref:Uncharacterized protein n=1 Tax=Arundo donax TaxID=35708 RepID=A0A0A9GKE3_ARUDO
MSIFLHIMQKQQSTQFSYLENQVYSFKKPNKLIIFHTTMRY